MAAATTRALPDLSKLEPLDGSNYKRWSQKLLIFFEQLEVDYVLFTNVEDNGAAALPLNDKAADDQMKKKLEKDNKTIRGHMLNHMSNTLFDLFVNVKSSKKIWELLEKKYGGDDAGKKKYVVGKWLQFCMVDDKPIMEQLHMYENLTADVVNEGMKMCEILQANVLLEKFPPSWSDYRNLLKHKKIDLTLQELIGHMRTEEANRLKDKSISYPNFNANLVDTSGVSGKGKAKQVPKRTFQSDRNKANNFKGDRKIAKKQFNCYVCGIPGHKAYQCFKRHGPQQSNTKPDGQIANHANLAETDEIIAAVVVEANLAENKSDWILDTGASRHFCTNKDVFHNFEEVGEGECVYMGNSSVAGVLGKGKILLKLTSGKTLCLNNVLYVPSMRRNLISGGLLNKAGLKIVFEADRVVLTRNRDFVGKGYLCDGIFVLNVASEIMNENASSSAYIVESVNIWHARLGHVNMDSIKRLRKLQLLPDMDLNNTARCQICVEAKHSKRAFKSVEHRNTELLELIHSDLADFKGTVSKGGKMYYVSFVDDFSRYTRIYLLKSKDEAAGTFMKYKLEVENQLNRKIKRLRSDRGGEYCTSMLKQFCEQNGIIHEYSAPYTPQQNGLAERKNRSLKDMMNAMLLSSGLPDNMWGEAVLSACYILNRLPHKKLDKTPYELWKGFAPNFKFLKVWGCLSKVGLPLHKRSNIGSKTYDAIFVGYAQCSAAYRFLSLEDRSISESCDAEFFENIFPLKSSSGGASSSSCDPDRLPFVDDHVTSNELRRSKRQRTETNFGDDFITFLIENPDKINRLAITAFFVYAEPRTYNEALRSIDAFFWIQATKSELNSILSKHTWDLVDFPVNCKAIRTKWIFKRKLKPDGSIDKYKARLVVVGFSQKKDVDYFATYSPVAKIATIRAIIALAAIHNLIIHQMDVKTAFLNGDLDEEIYINQAEGFVTPGQESKVCKLRKSLYGLKQALIQWYEKFNAAIISNGFTVNTSDSCLYSKMVGSDCVIICLYVDDMLVCGTSIDVILETKSFLSSVFDMKDLGEADVILGIKIQKTEHGFLLNQSHYVEKILRRFNCFDLVPVKTPFDPSSHLKKNTDASVSQEEYARIMGSVMYLMNCTRPDIAYAVSRLSRYTHNPSNEHWNALHRLLRYLKGTSNWGLHFNKFPAVLESYCDANWVSDNDEVSSTSGYVFTLGGGAISWKSVKQSCIASSTMESEFIALELAGREAEWLRNLLAEIPLCRESCAPVSLHCDSQAAIGVAKNSVYNGKRRHIRVRHGIVKQLLKDGVIALDFVRSERNIADPLTKGLSKRLVLDTSKEMGLKPCM